MSNQTPSTSSQPRVVGQYADPQAAEQAYSQLLAAGLLPEQVELKTREADPPIGQTQAVKGGKGGAVMGAVLGGLIGLMYSLGVNYHLFGLRPVLPLNTAIASISLMLVGGIVGSIALGLIGALAGVNVPKETAPDLGRLSQRYFLMVKGSDTEIKRAIETLQRGK